MLVAITGGIAETHHVVPADTCEHALTYLDKRLLAILNPFESRYKSVIKKKRTPTTE